MSRHRSYSLGWLPRAEIDDIAERHVVAANLNDAVLGDIDLAAAGRRDDAYKIVRLLDRVSQSRWILGQKRRGR